MTSRTHDIIIETANSLSKHILDMGKDDIMALLAASYTPQEIIALLNAAARITHEARRRGNDNQEYDT